MQIIFTGQIKEVRSKVLASNDKSTQILLQQDNLRDEVISTLNQLLNSGDNESKELIIAIKAPERK